MRLLVNYLTATLGSKTSLGVVWGMVLTPVLALIEHYFFKDWTFVSSLGMLILVDTVFGVQHHWQAHSISSRAFSRLFKKAFIYLGLLVLTHQLTGYQVNGEVNGVFSAWFDKFMYAAMMAREAVSILEHIAALEPRLVPKVLLKRLALISDGDLSALATPPAPTPGLDAPPSSPSNAQ